MRIYRIWVNHLPYMGEDPEKFYTSGEPWSGTTWQTRRNDINVLVFDKLGVTPKPIVGDKGLKSELDRIIRRSQDGLLHLMNIRIESEEAVE